jgi:hypothetical protein
VRSKTHLFLKLIHYPSLCVIDSCRMSFYIYINMISADENNKIEEALRSIIEGKIVKRIRHDLVYDGKDWTSLFIDELQSHGYNPSTVAQVNVQPGERVPAFYTDGSVAYFGWVFWEQFTSWKLRKLWGSVLKNKNGDWDIQIPSARPNLIYANESLKLEMDIDHPPEF